MFTIPNALSILRGALIPVFLTLAGDRRDGLALLVLAIASLTDYFDGKVARWLHQESKLGAILDPLFDRFYIAASLYVLWDRGIFPTWLALLLVARDAVLLIVNIVLQRKRLPVLVVNYIGKAATFNLLYAFPLLFLSQSDGWVGTLGYVLGWAFSAWGVGLYIITGIGYLVSAIKSIRFPNGLIISN
ncbi:MAG: CDP-alcohol phosphatidyltransferase family protein [Actinomycetales bacterium]|jgi:cardiolipin synthase (CMP-forming)|nr:CDP-alcohol phosphatidyltransferase family protein [Actinomycetales bacterium]